MSRKAMLLFVIVMLFLSAVSALADRAAAEKHYRAALELSKTDLDKAEVQFRAAIAEDGQYVPALLGLARLLLEGRGKGAEAIVYLDQALAIEPKNFEAHLMKGTCLLRMGQKEALTQAVASFQKALQLEPGSAVAHRFLALTYGALGEQDKAKAEFEAAIKIEPAMAETRFEYGLLLMNMGKPAEAAAHLERAAGLDKDNADYLWALGMAYKRLARYDDAIGRLEKAVALRPRSAAIMSDLGTAYAAKKDLNAAISWYQKAVLAEPKFAAAHYNMACAFAQQKKTLQAVEALRAAIEIAPGLRETAKKDPDFDPIRGDKGFKELVEKGK